MEPLIKKKKVSRYSALIEHIFWKYYTKGDSEVNFSREEFAVSATEIGITLPKNLGDIPYSFRFRKALPTSITDEARDEMEWVIKSKGISEYSFVLVKYARILPDPMMATIKIPDATPSIVDYYALGDEQALLTKLRYNRLIDIFTGVTCYSLQNHLRTTVPGIGQVETDEIYVGVDKAGRQYVFPVQAKGGSDEIGTVQIEQDMYLCAHKYPLLICRSIAAQFTENGNITIFEFTLEEGHVKKVAERQYTLVEKNEIMVEDIQRYNQF